MKARDAATTLALRTCADAAIKRAAMDANKEIDEALVTATMRKGVKNLADARIEFEKGGRADLVAANNAEIAILEKYLPKGLDPAKLEALVVETIAATGRHHEEGNGQKSPALKARPRRRSSTSVPSASWCRRSWFDDVPAGGSLTPDYSFLLRHRGQRPRLQLGDLPAVSRKNPGKSAARSTGRRRAVVGGDTRRLLSLAPQSPPSSWRQEWPARRTAGRSSSPALTSAEALESRR